LISNNISGVDFTTANLDFENSRQNYYLISINGRIRNPVWDKENLYPSKHNSNFYYYKGLFYDFSTWDQCDFFLEEDEDGYVDKRIIVTEKVVHLLEDFNIKSFRFINIRDYEIKKSVIEQEEETKKFIKSMKNRNKV
jgi:hypothetical protein